jgi:hypothetical protein
MKLKQVIFEDACVVPAPSVLHPAMKVLARA